VESAQATGRGSVRTGNWGEVAAPGEPVVRKSLARSRSSFHRFAYQIEPVNINDGAHAEGT